MIASVVISGFRGIYDGRLEDLRPLVVLVGPNGSGKSTVLEAMLIAASPDPGQAICHAIQRRFRLNEGSRWLLWRTHGSNPSSVAVTADEFMRDCLLESVVSEHNNGASNRILFSFDDILSGGGRTHYKGNYVEFDTSGKCIHNRLYHPFNGIRDLAIVESLVPELQPPLHDLFSRAVEQGRKKEVIEMVSEILRSDADLVILTEGSRPILHLDYGDHSVPVALAGDGVQSLIRLSLELTSRSSGVLLLEEPELHQHPGSIVQTARAILAGIRRGMQVIITTHSLDLIDALVGEARDDEELDKLCLYRLVLDKGVLRSSSVPGTEVAFARSEIGDDLR